MKDMLENTKHLPTKYISRGQTREGVELSFADLNFEGQVDLPPLEKISYNVHGDHQYTINAHASIRCMDVEYQLYWHMDLLGRGYCEVSAAGRDTGVSNPGTDREAAASPFHRWRRHVRRALVRLEEIVEIR